MKQQQLCIKGEHLTDGGMKESKANMLSCALYHGIFITTSWKCIRRKAHEEIISTLGDIQHKKGAHEKSLCCVYQNQRRKERKELIIAIVVECVVRVSEPKERPPPVRLSGSCAMLCVRK